MTWNPYKRRIGRPKRTFNEVIQQDNFSKPVMESKNPDLKILFPHCIGVHHAGMVRSDRLLTEKLFASGAIKVYIFQTFYNNF